MNKPGQGPRNFEFMRTKNFDPCSWCGTDGHHKETCQECIERETKISHKSLSQKKQLEQAFNFILGSNHWSEVDLELAEQLKDGIAGLLFSYDVYEAAEIAARAYYNFEEHFIDSFKKECRKIYGQD